MNEPTEKELYLNIAGQCTATATSEPAASILVDGGNGTLRQLLNDAADAIRAGWSTPQPTQAQAGAVPLTDEQLAEMMRETWGCASIAPRHAMKFARAIEAAHGIGIKGGQHGAE